MPIEDSAAVLLRGDWPDQPPWTIRQAVASIAARIARNTESPSTEQVTAACRILRSRRFFDSVTMLAQVHMRNGGDCAAIRSLGIQSSIELNAFSVAEAEVNACRERVKAGGEYCAFAAEFDGQLARIFKQRYVQDHDEADLRQAIAHYGARYIQDGDSAYWHGINLVALTRRAQKDWPGSPWVAALDDVDSVARSVYAAALSASGKRHDDGAEWAFATLSEAALGLGNEQEAELWLYRFLALPRRSLFALHSYQRQLREIWEANAYAEPPTCADTLAGIISENIDRRFDERSFSPAELDTLAGNEKVLEKNFSGDGFFSVDSVRKMLESCQAIGCVTSRLGIRQGTGFLVEGSQLDPRWGHGLVFVTNSHVLGGAIEGSLSAKDALVTFDVDNQAIGTIVSYPISRILFSSPPGAHGVVRETTQALDVTVCVLDGLPQKRGLVIADDLPLVTGNTRAYVIGHPRGAEIQVSLHDSRILDIDSEERLVHYRTPTDPGSSGSPVFNKHWKLIALHHAGSSRMPKFAPDPPPPFYEANEGISLVAIRRAIRASN